jgi:drug/metabolite transporter (DMT)-like permease
LAAIGCTGHNSSMKSVAQIEFERNCADAAGAPDIYNAPVIRTRMNRADWLILFALALIWGGAFFFIHVAVHSLPPLTYVWLRLSIAAGGLLLYLKAKGEPLGLPREVWKAMLILSLLNNVLPFALFGWSQQHIASGLASILNATTPIWGVVVAHLFTRDERMTPARLAGVVLGFGGVAMMIAPTLAGTAIGALPMLACVTASLSYALAAVYARRFRAVNLKPLSVSTGQLTAGALIMLPVALIADRPWILAMPSLGAWSALAALALICTAFAYVLYFRLIDHAGATNALLVTLLVPPTAILLGGLFLGERLAAQDFFGLGLIALGLAAIDGRLLSVLRRPLPRPAA